jgi:hypothetical protein
MSLVAVASEWAGGEDFGDSEEFFGTRRRAYYCILFAWAQGMGLGNMYDLSTWA